MISMHRATESERAAAISTVQNCGCDHLIDEKNDRPSDMLHKLWGAFAEAMGESAAERAVQDEFDAAQERELISK